MDSSAPSPDSRPLPLAELPDGADPLEEVGTADLAQALTTALEKRLARLGFDIHDGPLQKLLLLSSELALFRRQLASVPVDGDCRRMLEGRFEDVGALAESAVRELRSLITTRKTVASALPLRQLLEQVVERFRSDTDIRVEADIGDLQPATESQRLACLHIVEEALANVRRHSDARNVRVSALQHSDAIILSVRDDGRGFDVTRATRRAARDGRLGLMALSERARLLGGRLEIWSRPGGPTVVTAMLPLWDPTAKTRRESASSDSRVSA